MTDLYLLAFKLSIYKIDCRYRKHEKCPLTRMSFKAYFSNYVQRCFFVRNYISIRKESFFDLIHILRVSHFNVVVEILPIFYIDQRKYHLNTYHKKL